MINKTFHRVIVFLIISMLILNNSVFSQVIITEQSEYMQSNDKIVFSDQNIIVKVNNSQEMRILSENIFYGIEVEEV